MQLHYTSELPTATFTDGLFPILIEWLSFLPAYSILRMKMDLGASAGF
jgi:hypothetical protein